MALFRRFPVRIRRLAYRLAYLLLRVYWFSFRPTMTGAKCVLSHGELVLLVRHTYGRPAWDLPGGAVKRGEPPATAARREMLEELGIPIDAWQPLGELRGSSEHRQDALHCFRAELDERQLRELNFDLGEIAAAAWFPRADLPPALGTYVRSVLGLISD
jgi:8-oxo-dGTP diphosphatase